jgi:hypothetical protein
VWRRTFDIDFVWEEHLLFRAITIVVLPAADAARSILGAKITRCSHALRTVRSSTLAVVVPGEVLVAVPSGILHNTQ